MSKHFESAVPSWISKRRAGILAHITSLPGPAFTGDIGPGAKAFADFLAAAKQSVWQLLPVNPTTAEQFYSPYSASSAMAANPLLISIEWLVEKNLLNRNDIVSTPSNEVADFKKAESYKESVLHKAWLKWNKDLTSKTDHAFEHFCAKEDYWLNDYAHYAMLKEKFNHAPWYQWPETIRAFKLAKTHPFSDSEIGEIRRIKWIQWIFDQQWQELKQYCNERGIDLMGDMPMYVAHDSADVWSNTDIFTLNIDGSMSEVSGVPPDLFNDDGQLWGTPLYRWDVIQSSRFDWWIRRFRRNFALFDIMRLDHFRGFSAYWAVPANAITAKSGTWKQGPANYLFTAVEEKLGVLNIVAEDLGEIDQPVYDLRDALALPGMNVLQFAFNDKREDSIYLPHHHRPNSIVYTGTHDNNTTKGWYKSLSRKERSHVAAYVGKRVSPANISNELCRVAYQSVSNLVVLPLQDVLSLDKSCRMNVPAATDNNWTWRLSPDALTPDVAQKLADLVRLYARTAEINKLTTA